MLESRTGGSGMSDIANLGSLAGILLINLLVVFSFDKHRRESPGELNRLFVAHILWTITWFLWLLSWLVIGKSDETAIVLNDLGAFSLIAFAIAFLVGTDALRKYGAPLVTFFALDVVFFFAIDRLVHYDHTVNEKVIPAD